MKRRQRKPLLHRGLWHRRTTWSGEAGQRERVFAEEWERENARGTLYRPSTLQLLMRVEDRAHPFRMLAVLEGGRWAFRIRQAEATIVASVVQWMGTPIGFEWLRVVLRRCGYELVRIKDREET